MRFSLALSSAVVLLVLATQTSASPLHEFLENFESLFHHHRPKQTDSGKAAVNAAEEAGLDIPDHLRSKLDRVVDDAVREAEEAGQNPKKVAEIAANAAEKALESSGINVSEMQEDKIERAIKKAEKAKDKEAKKDAGAKAVRALDKAGVDMDEKTKYGVDQVVDKAVKRAESQGMSDDQVADVAANAAQHKLKHEGVKVSKRAEDKAEDAIEKVVEKRDEDLPPASRDESDRMPKLSL